MKCNCHSLQHSLLCQVAKAGRQGGVGRRCGWCERGPEMAWIDPSQYAVTVKTNEASQRCIFYWSCWWRLPACPPSCHPACLPATADIITQILSISPPSLCVCVCMNVCVFSITPCVAPAVGFTSLNMRRFSPVFCFCFNFLFFPFIFTPHRQPPFPAIMLCNPRLLKHSYRPAQLDTTFAGAKVTALLYPAPCPAPYLARP